MSYKSLKQYIKEGFNADKINESADKQLILKPKEDYESLKKWFDSSRWTPDYDDQEKHFMIDVEDKKDAKEVEKELKKDLGENNFEADFKLKGDFSEDKEEDDDDDEGEEGEEGDEGEKNESKVPFTESDFDQVVEEYGNFLEMEDEEKEKLKKEGKKKLKGKFDKTKKRTKDQIKKGAKSAKDFTTSLIKDPHV